MGISEIKNTDLVLIPPSFKCDDVISDKIKPPLPNKAFACAFMGAAGSGKTSLMINMLTQDNMYLRKFDHIHLFAPMSSMGSLNDDIWADHPSDKIHNDLSYSSLEELFIKTKNRATKKPKPETTLIVIDDMAVRLKDRAVEGKLREMIFNRRHNYTSLMILVQSYKAMPLDLRKSLSHFYLWRPRNKKETEAIFEELMFLPKDISEQVMTYTFRDKHDFLMGDCVTGELFRNFNKLILPDVYNGEDDDEDMEGGDIESDTGSESESV